MAVRFEIFSILGILSWSTCSKWRKFDSLCCKMLYRDPNWLLFYFWLGRWAFSCKVVKWMEVRFEIFSILGVLCWSTCSKQRKFQFLCSKMFYRGPYWLLPYFSLGWGAFLCKIVKWMAVRFEIFSISG